VKSTPLKQFQSWKVTAALGVLLVATLVITRFTGQKPGVANMPPDHAEMVKTIETFEKQIKENPNDATALLQLANIYYDQKLFPRAIMMYDRYLVITPSNSDARVDLGTSYFQLALTDSTHRQEYFASAKSEMEKALKYTPNHQLACFNLAMVNLHTGDMEKATEWFKKCASIDSTSETGKRAQELIKQQSINHPPSS
jgi:tetratricopeptide (TPR) repeat protein